MGYEGAPASEDPMCILFSNDQGFILLTYLAHLPLRGKNRSETNLIHSYLSSLYAPYQSTVFAHHTMHIAPMETSPASYEPPNQGTRNVTDFTAFRSVCGEGAVIECPN